MNLNRSSERTGKRRLQFSIRTLLILTTIVGPVLGLYGPAVVDKLLELYADETVKVKVPSLRLQKARAAFALRLLENEKAIRDAKSGKDGFPPAESLSFPVHREDDTEEEVY
ncbi:hypothetical protein CA13_00050 [Planctomycetes bacterium CA13]|uniref:Uncharacterized protein n=1 Tax=Novipirellula herctigrandis TaxID=2527986 RepID=A0A5C5YUB7_9BACT|nr:hypothetical protein CA13_00050 [Planctomycetes bacterium CA13]